jgi:hypothetical protein
MSRYALEFGGAMLAYVVLLPLSIFAYRAVEQDGLKVLIAVVPVVPTLLGLVAILRAIRRMARTWRSRGSALSGSCR